MAAPHVIVIGGGLAGLSAAHTILERGGNVILLDKNSFLGGNSTKATSGINGAGTATQRKLGVPDTSEVFYEDSAKSARDLIVPALTKVLTYQSGAAVEWIQDEFKVDLSLISRLGGHSQPRTHRGKEMFPGMTITYALMERLEEIAEAQPTRAKVIKKADVKKIVKDGAKVVGVEYVRDGKTYKESGPVIIATGGYAADFTETSLLKKYRPELCHLPTTNGDHCTGDGIKLTEAIGGNTLHMEKVQVHPTGLVDPNEPDAKVKFLAAEALRGVGGLLLTADGHRFCDELGHRDYVTGKMWENKGPFRLILNGKGGKEIEWHCKHYMGRGLMKHFKGADALAKEMGIPVSTLDSTFTKYDEIARTKKDPFGKKFFHNTPWQTDDEFFVAVVTPVLHFTMGGIQIDEFSNVLQSGGKNVEGLFACGEVAGGVHGANRLGGSSLLGCVVYGRVAGATASKYILQDLSKGNASRRIGGIAGHLGGNQVNISVNGVNIALSFDGAQQGSSVGTDLSAADQTEPRPTEANTGPEPKGSKPKEQKQYTLEEVAKHNTEKDVWVVVNGEVLDATHFLKDHPGGKKAIMLYAGRDATEEFNMLHPKNAVAKYAPEIVIGTLRK